MSGVRNRTTQIRTICLLLHVSGCFLALPSRAHAQMICSSTKGYNAVYGTCNSTTGIVGSGAFVDASVFTPATDVCAQIYAALQSIQGLTPPPTGVVVDARGTTASLTCALGSTPFSQSGVFITLPSTVLLPKGTITISDTWVLPDRTRIIGTGHFQTVITAVSGFTTKAPMIQMGNSTVCGASGICTGVSVSDLELDGGGQDITGIVNDNAQELSYVAHVWFRWLEEIGLDIQNGASDSGPYVDLDIPAGGSGCIGCNPTSGTACVKIAARTRGIHGLTCTANGVPLAGVYLDANNNTIEDAHFEGLQDGILVGSLGAAAGNVIKNVSGASGGGTSAMELNVVHICGPHGPSGGTTPCTNPHAVTDLTVAQIETFTSSQAALVDDETATLLSVTTGDPAVGFYSLGQKLTGGTTADAYSRFTASTNPSSVSPQPTPTWGVNNVSPGSGTCPTGAIFSNTGGLTGTTIYVCVNSAWSPIP